MAKRISPDPVTPPEKLPDAETIEESLPVIQVRPNADLLRVSVDQGQTFDISTARLFDDAGADLPASINVSLPPHSSGLVPTGIRLAVPVGTVGLIIGRLSVFTDRGLVVTASVVSSGYRGELRIPVTNPTKAQQTVLKGQRVAQLFILPWIDPQTLMQPFEDLPIDNPPDDRATRWQVPPGSSGR
jgi:deoxyuridine 5'-triphosphate nucleotidohydrolase